MSLFAVSCSSGDEAAGPRTRNAGSEATIAACQESWGSVITVDEENQLLADLAVAVASLEVAKSTFLSDAENAQQKLDSTELDFRQPGWSKAAKGAYEAAKMPFKKAQAERNKSKGESEENPDGDNKEQTKTVENIVEEKKIVEVPVAKSETPEPVVENEPSDAYKKRGKQYENYNQDQYQKESDRQQKIFDKTGKWDFKNAPKI